jgi:rod shape-determining protein MreD
VRGARGSIGIVLIVFIMLLVQSIFSRLLAPYPLTPYLGLPFVFALGTARGVGLVRGAATAFAVGYLYDFFTGNPLGLHTLVFVVGFLAARLVGHLVSSRGLPFELAITFFLILPLGGLLETIRGFAPGGMAWDGVTLIVALLGSAFATALVAPPLFALIRRIDPQTEAATV